MLGDDMKKVAGALGKAKKIELLAGPLEYQEVWFSSLKMVLQMYYVWVACNEAVNVIMSAANSGDVKKLNRMNVVF